ncbi:OPT-domain-containing protein [Hyaloscypha bicolor E]|uniref:OPT-domain-containing protein n=1 Tax=Hyaloscypha bicolor E TaxID=1095630 RepID=A0A2J6SQ87_9HELO|nr:OPT-domain-containing protein [Hyaloscypha bicolor E]PMD52931.1 OPT-domain-containing protein [Hyaloscypha bicolor E]
MNAFSFATCLAWPTNLSWWALIIALLISFVWTIPIGIVYATINIHLGLNVFTEYIIGYMQPGRPLAMMLFKTYGYITIASHEPGPFLPARPEAWPLSQVVGTLWSCVVQLGTMEWALDHIKGICKSGQANNFTCPGLASSSTPHLQYFWLAGALVPIIIYLIAGTFPRSKARFVSAPIFFSGMGQLLPAIPLSYLSWSLVEFAFQKFIRNRYRGYAPAGTLDYLQIAVQKKVTRGQTFGPKVW